MAREDRFGRGSDHQAFRQAGFPSIVFREANENFSKQHTADDTVDGVGRESLISAYVAPVSQDPEPKIVG